MGYAARTVAVLTQGRLPKLAPDVIHRERLSRWLADHADFPLRLLAAPAGCGKTTALVLYATRSRFPAAYVSLGAGAGAAAIRDALCEALELNAVADTETLLAALGTLGRREILVDEADRASDEGRELLQRLVFDGPGERDVPVRGAHAGVLRYDAPDLARPRGVVRRRPARVHGR